MIPEAEQDAPVAQPTIAVELPERLMVDDGLPPWEPESGYRFLAEGLIREAAKKKGRMVP